MMITGSVVATLQKMKINDLVALAVFEDRTCPMAELFVRDSFTCFICFIWTDASEYSTCIFVERLRRSVKYDDNFPNGSL